MIKNILIATLSILLILFIGASILSKKSVQDDITVDTGIKTDITTGTSTPPVPTSPTPVHEPKPTAVSPHTKTKLKQGELLIENIISGQKISNPLTLTGSAPSGWYFEGSFGIMIKDKNGNVLGRAPAQSTSDWMNQSAPVRFSSEMNFKVPTTPTGTIVFTKDNPSDIRAYDESFSLPITFAEYAPTTKIVKIYFSNKIKNPNIIDCNAVYPVNREVANIPAIGKSTLIELLAGIKIIEQEQGYDTQINQFTVLNSLTIKDGIAYADFNEQLDYQVGGSCRVTMIRAQITETLKQFSTIKSVVISRNGQSVDILQP